MKTVVRLFSILLLLTGGIALIRLSKDNRELAQQIDQLEAELGRMSIGDSERVHLVEIETPDVPPEVASHIERVWQFRCYLPPGYDVIRFSGSGRVMDEGVYLAGGFSSGWGSPRTEATHELLTISFRKNDHRLEVFNTFQGSAGMSSWPNFDADRFNRSLAVEKIASSEQGPRSFDQNTILPILRIYDPNSAEVKAAGVKTITTYAGGLFVLCPKSREPEFNQLRRGETPTEFDASWIATEANDE